MPNAESHYTELPVDLLAWVQQFHSADKRRRYHNWQHVNRLYTWADKWSMPYDIVLDIGIAFHDCIYDEKPDKEIRSADVMIEVVPRFLPNLDREILDKAHALILTTIDHTPTYDNRLILCDLADFSVDFFREINSQNIKSESFALYGVSNAAYLHNSIKFIRGLRNRLEEGYTMWGEDTDKFADIIEGIGKAIASTHKAYAEACK